MDTNELVLNKSSMAEILDQSSCAFCHSNLWRSCAVSHSGNCRCDPQAQRRKSQCTLSTTKEILDKQKKLFHSKEPHGVTVKEENPSPGPKHLGRHRAEQCFLGSSVYYGGPDELYDIPQGRKEDPSEIKMAAKKLEDAMDPFQIEYATRGNWWEGSLYY
ncbi:uncharacterized protein LOC131028519 [Cryptomeria japonica]|uniref:uncharacterized protein LOC131028519 n=1 Tax=Cryptomeria japonica TaxID=3369 RepID=UPI0027DA603C|nr:uncharacterized protein LOC131028519 [Cryptomeria japonica]XP_057814784.2 uncharacterized protein LOC131028519 [Cryptomeria japonica]